MNVLTKNDAIPVSIITGFLGAGKTTLLNRLLRHEALRGSLVIINEFGDVGIDHLLVSTPVENIRLLGNGCLCCEVRGELVETMEDVWRRRETGEIAPFDRVLIETTGLADPVPIVQTIVTDKALADLYRLDAVITVVDAVHVRDQIDTQDELRKQIALADVLLLSKSDLVSADARADAEAAVRSINAGVEPIAVVQGEVDPARLLGHAHAAHPGGADVERWIGSMSRPSALSEHRGTRSRHAGDIRTFTLFRDAPVSVTGLTTWLNLLAGFRGHNLLRLKGIVNVAGEPHVVHAVQTVVHEPARLERWPSEDRRTRIVFIVRDLHREAIERTFAAFDMPELRGNSLQLDPATYATFVRAAKQFQ